MLEKKTDPGDDIVRELEKLRGVKDGDCSNALHQQQIMAHEGRWDTEF